MVKRLNVFDFDGTVFRSPVPSVDVWEKDVLGAMLNPPSGVNKGLGWFQSTITLEPPAVPEQIDEHWFNPRVVDAVRESMADADARTVLLTGRNEHYLPHVARIVASAGLVFDAMGLAPVPDEQGRKPMTTADYKFRFLENELRKCGDDLERFVIWEDRPAHAAKFERFCERFAGTRVESQVVLVDEPEKDTNLPADVEVELVHRLLRLRNERVATVGGEPLAFRPTRTVQCVQLDEVSRIALLRRFPQPDAAGVKPLARLFLANGQDGTRVSGVADAHATLPDGGIAVRLRIDGGDETVPVAVWRKTPRSAGVLGELNDLVVDAWTELAQPIAVHGTQRHLTRFVYSATKGSGRDGKRADNGFRPGRGRGGPGGRGGHSLGRGSPLFARGRGRGKQ